MQRKKPYTLDKTIMKDLFKHAKAAVLEEERNKKNPDPMSAFLEQALANLEKTIVEDETTLRIMRKMVDRAAALKQQHIKEDSTFHYDQQQRDKISDTDRFWKYFSLGPGATDQTTSVMQKFWPSKPTPHIYFYRDTNNDGSSVLKRFDSREYEQYRNDETRILIPAKTNRSGQAFVKIISEDAPFIPLQTYWNTATDLQIISALKNFVDYLDLTQLIKIICNNEHVYNLVLTVCNADQKKQLLNQPHLSYDEYDQTTAVMRGITPHLYSYEDFDINGKPIIKQFDSREFESYENNEIRIYIPPRKKITTYAYVKIKGKDSPFITLSAYWAQASDNQIIAALQTFLWRATSEQLLIIIYNDIRLLKLVLKRCKLEDIVPILKQTSWKLEFELLEETDFIKSLTKQQILVILKNVNTHINADRLKTFSDILSAEDQQKLLNDINEQYESQRLPSLYAYRRVGNNTVTLHFTGKPYAIESGNTEHIPLDVFFNNKTLDEITIIFKTAKEYQTQQTLFDLDDGTLLALVRQNKQVLRYFLTMAPSYQLKAILNIIPLGIYSDIMRSFLTSDDPLQLATNLSSDRRLTILTRAPSNLLKQLVINASELIQCCLGLNAADKIRFIDYFSSLLPLPQDIRNFTSHPDYELLAAARLSKPQPDIAQEMPIFTVYGKEPERPTLFQHVLSLHNKEHIARMREFEPNYMYTMDPPRSGSRMPTKHYKQNVCEPQVAIKILSPYGFTEDMLATLPATVPINALKLLVYLVTGLRPQNDKNIHPLPLDQCLTPQAALIEFNKANKEADLMLKLYAYGMRSDHFSVLRLVNVYEVISPAQRKKLVQLMTVENKTPVEAIAMVKKFQEPVDSGYDVPMRKRF